jgi:AhpD family alkylhydroperoxidase
MFYMKPRSLLGLLLVLLLAGAAGLAEESLTPLEELNRKARAKTKAVARVPLLPENAPAFSGIASLEPTNGGRAPNYLRAAATGAVSPLAHLVKTVLYEGAVEPEIKMAMGLRTAQVYGSAYLATHMQRMLRASARGSALLRPDVGRGEGAEDLAVRYAELLARSIHGVGDADFQKVRGYYNDSQIIELTLTACFFNYLVRYVEALNLPVEPWALDTPYTPPTASFEAPTARVGLLSDATIAWAASVKGPNVVNSMRAMNLSPEIAAAWRQYNTAAREGAAVSREIQLHVSFAVSMTNGCRYCTLHQVQGLRRLGVSPSKLVRMKKEDGALTPRELAAVVFARKLTQNPAGITDADYGRLRAEFGEQGARDVLLQTCTFAFMNRFTDGLRLPSEDEAIQIYRETYGADYSR